MMSLSNLIIGTWGNLEKDGINFGSSIDQYYNDGTKSIKITIQKGGKANTYHATASWKIDKNILSEEVIDIDKKATKAFGFKKGFKSRAYIQRLDEQHLTLKQLNTGDRYLTKPVTLTKMDNT